MVKALGSSVATMVAATEYKDRFAEAMRASGKTDKDLMGALGISYQAVMKVLDGSTRQMSAFNNSRAAKVMQVSADWLATGDGEMSAAPATNKDSLTVHPPTPADLAAHLAERLNTMDESALRLVRERLDALAVSPDSLRAREALATALAAPTPAPVEVSIHQKAA
jgi:transcriptional regulator with XRE-family HTH domain